MIKIYDGRNEFYQWDLNRQIIVSDPTVTEIHFCNKTGDCSLVVEVVDGIANVPNILLQTSWPIRAYAYCGDCFTKECATFKVIARTKPTDYVYTETEVKRWDALADEIEATKEEVEATVAEANILIDNLALAGDHEKRITNLEKHISNDYFVTDAAAANVKAVPTGACPYAQLNYIGGMSVKKTVAGDDVIAEDNSIYTHRWDGYIGDANLTYITLAPGLYHITFIADERIKVGYRNSYDYIRTYLDGAEGDIEVTADVAGEYEFFIEGNVGIGEYPIYFKLSTPKTVIEAVKPTAIKVKTPNLLPFPYTSTSSGREVMDVGFKHIWSNLEWEVKADGSIVVNGTATGSPCLQLSKDYLYADEDLFFSGSAEGGSSSTYYMVCYIEGKSQNTETGKGNKIPKGSRYKLGCYVIKGTVCDNLTFKPMVTYGTAKVPYCAPNREPKTIELPEEIISIFGYGEGNPNNANEFNYIDFENQKFVAEGYMIDGEWVKNEPPVETPITFENIIEVEPAERIEFVNDSNAAVPSSITYLTKEGSK